MKMARVWGSRRNVTVVASASVVSFFENATSLGPVTSQTYARLSAPSSSSATTLNAVVFPVTGAGKAVGPLVICGADLNTFTVLLAVCARPSLSVAVSVMIYLPASVGWKTCVVMPAVVVPV